MLLVLFLVFLVLFLVFLVLLAFLFGFDIFIYIEKKMFYNNLHFFKIALDLDLSQQHVVMKILKLENNIFTWMKKYKFSNFTNIFKNMFSVVLRMLRFMIPIKNIFRYIRPVAPTAWQEELTSQIILVKKACFKIAFLKQWRNTFKRHKPDTIG